MKIPAAILVILCVAMFSIYGVSAADPVAAMHTECSEIIESALEEDLGSLGIDRAFSLIRSTSVLPHDSAHYKQPFLAVPFLPPRFSQ